jgi:hypothetical protein
MWYVNFEVSGARLVNMKRVILDQTLSGDPRQIIVDDNILHVVFGRPIFIGFVLLVCSFVPFAIVLSGAYEIRASYASVAIMLLIGIGCLAGGLFFIYGRAGMIINKGKGEIIEYRRLFFRLPSTQIDIRGAKFVKMRHTEYKGKHGHYIVDTIELEFTDKPSVTLFAENQGPDTAILMQEIADFLEIPAVDVPLAPREKWQIHLSTAFILMIFASVFLYIFVAYWQTQEFPSLTFLICSFALLSVVFIVCESWIKRN